MVQVLPIPALSDNYIWLIKENHQAIIVDPAEDQKVLDVLKQANLTPAAILLTHNHADHTDGVAGIKAEYVELPVYGSIEVAEFADQILHRLRGRPDIWNLPVIQQVGDPDGVVGGADDFSLA